MSEKKCQTVTIHLEPDMRVFQIRRPKTVAQLFTALNLPRETALVARNGKLLTHDRHIWPNDELLVRIVISSG